MLSKLNALGVVNICSLSLRKVEDRHLSLWQQIANQQYKQTITRCIIYKLQLEYKLQSEDTTFVPDQQITSKKKYLSTFGLSPTCEVPHGCSKNNF